MRKLLRKILFILHISQQGADLRSKWVLLREAVRTQKNFYTGGQNRLFHCRVGTRARSAPFSFIGTLDDLHALTEIFVEQCYDPKLPQLRTALDLGANIGLATLWLWLRYPRCIIHAYEPDPDVFAVLEKNVAGLPNVRAFNYAIVDRDGAMQFHSARRSFSSSLYPVSASRPITVSVKSLDRTIKDIGGSVDFIKMDIEGAEFAAIEGSRLLANVRVIVGEVHPEKAGRAVEEFRIRFRTTHTMQNEDRHEKSLFRCKRHLGADLAP